MYAIENGLANRPNTHFRWFWKLMAVTFAFFTALATFGIGSTVQANAISTLGYEVCGIPPVVIGGIVTILAAAVIMGGVKSIARCCQMLVPFMAGVYIIGCLAVLFINGAYLLPALELIVQSAFDPSAAGGGLVGSSIMITARYGIARGLFSNESGLGSAPIIAASAQTKNPVRQALVSSSATFWDTVIICALTGLAIVSSIVAYPDISASDGGVLTKMAFSKIPYLGEPLLAFGSLTFAFSTILSWNMFGKVNVVYLFGKKNPKLCTLIYTIIGLVFIFVGTLVSNDLVWELTDAFNYLMVLPNAIALFALSGIVVKFAKRNKDTL